METTAINGTGNTANNVITGNSANNTLNGGAGNDIMIGGTGDDSYFVDAVGDVVTENLNEGKDSILSYVSYTLGANIEDLSLMGTAAINGTGNSLNNYLAGNDGNNILTGGAGNDLLSGRAGNDTLVGGIGDDSYFVDAVGDVVTENLNEGKDSILSYVSYTLGANIEDLSLMGTVAINGIGNALNNYLFGNDNNNSLTGSEGNDTLSGQAGNDTLVGGAGDDLYFVDAVGDIVTENLNEGKDRILSYVSYTLGANIEDLSLMGTVAINGIGNALNNYLSGNNDNNILTGGEGNDTLSGGAGNDTLSGGTGIDTLMALVTS